MDTTGYLSSEHFIGKIRYLTAPVIFQKCLFSLTDSCSNIDKVILTAHSINSYILNCIREGNIITMVFESRDFDDISIVQSFYGFKAAISCSRVLDDSFVEEKKTALLKNPARSAENEWIPEADRDDE